MTEPQQKGVRKGIVITLGILVVILGFSTISIYTTLQSQITNLQNQVNDLNSDKSTLQSQLNSLYTSYQDYVSTHSYSDTEFNSLFTEYNSLNAEYGSYVTAHGWTNTEVSDIANLAYSDIWVNNQTVSQPASYYSYWTVSTGYAGYVSVNVQSSTTTNTFVEVVWSAYGISYDNKITVGASGTAVFPVLPASIQVRVGNTNLANGATETVTIIYYY
jgi:hypothetical protein